MAATDMPNEKQQDESPPSTDGAQTPLSNKEESSQQSQQTEDSQSNGSDGPPGGFDSTPIPSPPPGTVGYTVKFTLHHATNLAMGDAHVLSSDPYVLAQINSDLPVRHKEDPNLRFRTPTVRKSTDPEWNEEWIVANVPSSGFKLKLRVYDEDPADQDDLLGKVHITVPSIDDQWVGMKNQVYQLVLRDSSKRALLVRAVANCFGMVEHFRGEIFVSMENLGRTGEDGQNGRMYTVGPCRWIRHYSPILGRLANIKSPDDDDQVAQAHGSSLPPNGQPQKKIERYNFQANQMQFAGPVPTKLYHRYVEFKPWVRRMFTTSGLQGIIMSKALHGQHSRVYSFGRSTVWGYFPQGPCKEMTKQFLDLVRYDKGGRIFTYVLTLDALFRFTETGKEFGIDMLSKHTMHSDVSVYIAFSGEFFIRRLKRRKRSHSTKHSDSDPDRSTSEPIHTDDLAGPKPEDDEQPPTDPSHYELIIDNDSGTYRPNAETLPLLAKYLSQSLPGLHIQTLDCQADQEKMEKLKSEQRERKKREGDNLVYYQADDSSSISSSDEEELDEIQAGYEADGTPSTLHQNLQSPEPTAAETKTDRSRARSKQGVRKERSALSAVAKDVKLRQEGKIEKLARNVRFKDREDATSPGAILDKVRAIRDA